MLWKLCRFREVGARRRVLFLEAAMWLLTARIILLIVPFRRIARHLGTVASPTDDGACPSTTLPDPEPGNFAREIGWAIACAARHVPFKAICLPQAIAAKQMLRRRGVSSVLHFGVATSDKLKGLEAHAWLDAASVKVTGYPVASTFTEVVRFK